MAVPEQVRRQNEAAAAFYNTMSPVNGTGGGDPDQTQPGNVVNSPGADTRQTTAASPVNEQTGGDDPNSETYQQRWRSLQGMYNSDIGRLQTQLRERDARMTHLEGLIATLSTAPAQPTAPQPARPQAMHLVSEADTREYGDSIDVMRKVSREEVYPVLRRLEETEGRIREALVNVSNVTNNLAPQVQRVAQNQARTAEQTFWMTLSAHIPNWQSINNDPDFQDWLVQVDPLTGHTRQAFLNQAQQENNAERVISIFQLYGTGGNQSSATAQPSRSAASELERQIAPGRSRGAGAPADQTRKTYTTEDIKEFFADVRKGKYKGRETERDRIERDIFTAQSDGRIVATR